MSKFFPRLMRMSTVGSLAAGLMIGVAWADPPPWAGGGRDDHHDRHRDHEDRHADRDERRDDRRDHQADRRDHNERRHERREHYHITTREQFYINDWYRRHQPPAPRGYGRIPPGLTKRLERGAPWPPPYAYAPLPHELARGLQPLPSGYRYYRVGPDVVIANIAGKVVADVVYDLLNR